MYYDNPDGWLMLAGDDEQEALKRLSAEVLLPLPGRNELVGVIAMGPKRSEAPIHAATWPCFVLWQLRPASLSRTAVSSPRWPQRL